MKDLVVSIGYDFVYLNNKCIGRITGDTFYYSGWLFRKFNGVAMSVVVLEFLKERNIEKIHISMKGEEHEFDTDVQRFFEKGIEWVKDGFEHQLILPLDVAVRPKGWF